MHKIIIKIFLIILSSLPVSASEVKGGYPKNLHVLDKPVSYKNITLMDEADKQIGIESFNKKLYIIYFFASWCSDCIDEIKQLQSFQQSMDGRLMVIPVSEDYKSKKEVVNELVDRFKLSEKFYFDEKQGLFKTMNIKTIPTSIILTNDQEEIARVTGRGNWEDQYLRSLLIKYLDKLN